MLEDRVKYVQEIISERHFGDVSIYTRLTNTPGEYSQHPIKSMHPFLVGDLCELRAHDPDVAPLLSTALKGINCLTP